MFEKNQKICMTLNALTPIFGIVFSFIAMNHFRKYDITDIFYNIGNYNNIIGIRLKLDVFSALGLFFVNLLHTINTILQNFRIARDVDSIKIGLINIMIGGLSGMILSDDFFNLYVFIEIVSIVSYILSISKWNKRSYHVALEYLIIGSVASCLILFGIGFVYANFGTLNMSKTADLIMDASSYGDLVVYSVIFIIIGLLIKTGLYPFHTWYIRLFKNITPSVMCLFSYASSQVVILVIVKLIYSIFSVQLITSSLQYLISIMSALAIISILYGSYKAIVVKSMVEVLVWSSISQVGYLIIGLISDNEVVVSGCLMQIFANAISKVLIFRIYQKMISAVNSSNLIDVNFIGRFDFSGIRMPLVIILINLAGLPMAIGFMAKIYMIVGFVSEGRIGSFMAIIVSSILSVIYTFRIIEGVIIGNKPGVKSEIQFYKIPTSSGERFTYTLISIILIFIPFVKPVNNYFKMTTNYILKV
ncbi:proton-conducting transporter transmembrane domain-containing protein [Candidatus Deianiraea vastatrix]|nr:proton-conducting transporter membrane subunit [Candidatus Deianiraea vastatrix]